MDSRSRKNGTISLHVSIKTRDLNVSGDALATHLVSPLKFFLGRKVHHQCQTVVTSAI